VKLEPLSFLVVEPNDLMRAGFKVLLSAQPWVEHCSSARAVDVATARLARPIDVALVDVSLWHEAQGSLVSASPGLRLIVSVDGSSPPPALRGSSVICKGRPAAEIVTAVWRAVLHRPEPARSHLPDLLSAREGEVLHAYARGMTTEQAASALSLSPNTIKSHAKSLYRKLDARNRAHAIAKARTLGLLTPTMTGPWHDTSPSAPPSLHCIQSTRNAVAA
jgi:DNA-binding NarL/FixJ family response regulator